MNDDNISFTTMQKYAADMFLVLQDVEKWKAGEEDNEFDSAAIDILNKMRAES